MKETKIAHTDLYRLQTTHSCIQRYRTFPKYGLYFKFCKRPIAIRNDFVLILARVETNISAICDLKVEFFFFLLSFRLKTNLFHASNSSNGP